MCSWEEIINEVREEGRRIGFKLGDFYGLCLKYNGLVKE